MLILPFRKALRHAPDGLVRAGTYFALIGLGFMFVEITLMQMMRMFLGHPVYGLGIVLFSMILSAGMGSFLSESFRLDTPPRLALWALATAAYVAFLSASTGILLGTFIESPFPVRVALCVGLISPAA